jgi:hypothetical protein
MATHARDVVWTPNWPRVECFWYAKARHIDTGAEIQRLFANGATSEAEAEYDMWRYLERLGRATADVDRWKIVEVARWP